MLAATAVAILPLIGTEFFPPSDESQFLMQRARPGRHAGRGDGADRRADGRDHPLRRPSRRRSRPIVSTVGVPGRAARASSPEHRAPRGPAPGVPERPRQAEAQRHARSSRRSARSSRDQFPGTTYRRPVRRHREPHPELRRRTRPIEVEQLGYDLKDAQATRPARSRARSRRSPGVADVFISREENYPQFDIVVDREKAAMAGLSPARHRPGRAVLARTATSASTRRSSPTRGPATSTTWSCSSTSPSGSSPEDLAPPLRHR